MNNKGFTFLSAIFMVVIIGVMLGMTGQSWKTVMKREREKELLFRGSQIKEAIEKWYKVKPGKHNPIALTDLELLIEDRLNPSGSKVIYLPYTYATKLDEKNSKCAPDCPKTKLLQDPMTGKEWDVIKCGPDTPGHEICLKYPGTNTIIGVVSKSKDTPLRTKLSFKDTALENMGTISAPPQTVGAVGTTPAAATPGAASGVNELTKYSEWKFIADPKNDQSKIHRAYREGW